MLSLSESNRHPSQLQRLRSGTFQQDDGIELRDGRALEKLSVAGNVHVNGCDLALIKNGGVVYGQCHQVQRVCCDEYEEDPYLSMSERSRLTALVYVVPSSDVLLRQARTRDGETNPGLRNACPTLPVC